jgi:hypothetical protein
MIFEREASEYEGVITLTVFAACCCLDDFSLLLIKVGFTNVYELFMIVVPPPIVFITY